MTDVQLFEKVLGFLQQTIAYSNEEMSRLDELKRWVRERLSQPEPRPIAWLSKCYNDDNEQIGYTLWDRDVGEGCFPVYTIDMSEKHVHISDKYRHEWGLVTDDALIEEVRRRGFTIRDAQISPKQKPVACDDDIYDIWVEQGEKNT
jgi:hypothetical protein